MNSPNLVRKIYAELRSVAWPDVSSPELLRAASELAAAYHSTTLSDERGATYYAGGLPFHLWSLDRAMADGGWRVLAYESNLARAVFGEQPDSEEFAIDDWMAEHAT